MIELRNILMATDFTRCSRQGRLMARDLCRRFKATLHLLHVIDDRATGLSDAAVRVVEPTAQYVDRHIAQEQQAMVKLWAELFPDYKKDHEIEFAAVFGHPVVQIVEYAGKHSIDLIVAGTHGRTGFDHFLSGSIAEQLVRMAACPVLIVHSPPEPVKLEDAVDIRERAVKSAR